MGNVLDRRRRRRLGASSLAHQEWCSVRGVPGREYGVLWNVAPCARCSSPPLLGFALASDDVEQCSKYAGHVLPWTSYLSWTGCWYRGSSSGKRCAHCLQPEHGEASAWPGPGGHEGPRWAGAQGGGDWWTLEPIGLGRHGSVARASVGAMDAFAPRVRREARTGVGCLLRPVVPSLGRGRRCFLPRCCSGRFATRIGRGVTL